MKRIMLERAFVFCRRAYRETSLLIELFTYHYGRVSVIAKGVRKVKSSSQGILQPFVPLLVSLSGRGDLMSLSQVEINGEIKQLKGENLFAGFYLNELLMILLQRWDAHPVLYECYAKTISNLQLSPLNEKWLRSFEKCLLEEIGYGLLPKSAVTLQHTFAKESYYRFSIEQGFLLDEGNNSDPANFVFSGKSLISIANEEWENLETLKDAKRLIRIVLSSLLGNRSIYSRELFKKNE